MSHSLERRRIVGGIGADDPYWRALEDGEFRLPRCAGCGRWIWPAHYRCGRCGGWEMEWRSLAPEGLIFSWTRSWYAFERVAERADDLPYVTALVELPEADGARVLGLFEGAEPRIGAPVRGVIRAPSPKSKSYPSIVWHSA